MDTSGIYKIQSQIKPERIYIGSAVNFRKRKILHLHQLRNDKHANTKLQNHFNKYGESDLVFSLVLGCKREELINNEQFFIDAYSPWFNINQRANSCFGRVVSEKTRRLLSDAKLGVKKKPLSLEHRKKLSDSLMGNKRRLGTRHSEEIRRKISDVLTQVYSEEHRQIIRDSNTKNKTGKHLSDETKLKISIANKGRKLSDEARYKISISHKGKLHKPITEETRKRMIESHHKNRLIKI